LGLDDPPLVQYVRYVANTVRGDFGTSIRSQRPVLDEIRERLPSTAELALGGLFFSAIIGIPMGVAAAATRRRWLSGLVMATSVLGLSIPGFWLAVLGLIVFGVNLKWITVMGGQGIKDLILPSLCLGLGEGAVLARLTYTTVSETLLADYVRTARAKGLADRLVLWRHALRNALIPILTVVGLQIGNLLSGSVFMEAVFARPGLGRYAINAINNRDFPQIQGMVLFTALIYVLVNLAIDIAYAWADPRIR
jgi:ABC-type dipeptide/oligopeptide/nickel transport system permease component